MLRDVQRSPSRAPDPVEHVDSGMAQRRALRPRTAATAAVLVVVAVAGVSRRPPQRSVHDHVAVTGHSTHDPGSGFEARGHGGVGRQGGVDEAARAGGAYLHLVAAFPQPVERLRVAERNGCLQPVAVLGLREDLELRIPKLRTGSFFPSLLERRRRVDQALFAVVMEAYLHGVSTRKVDDLVKALGADTGISKSEVSRICADLDAEVSSFRDRSLAGQAFP